MKKYDEIKRVIKIIRDRGFKISKYSGWGGCINIVLKYQPEQHSFLIPKFKVNSKFSLPRVAITIETFFKLIKIKIFGFNI
jgi:hypothetical protein